MCQIDDVEAWARAAHASDPSAGRQTERRADDAEAIEAAGGDLPAYVPPMPPHRPRRKLPWDGR